MQHEKVPPEATDTEIQKRLHQLYNPAELLGERDKLQGQLTAIQTHDHKTILAIGESSIQMDVEMRQRMMWLLQSEEQYADILQHLKGPTQGNEVVKNEKVYRIKRGTLIIHERNQARSTVIGVRSFQMTK